MKTNTPLCDSHTEPSLADSHSIDEAMIGMMQDADYDKIKHEFNRMLDILDTEFVVNLGNDKIEADIVALVLLAAKNVKSNKQVFTCVDHAVHYPVGGASIIVAENVQEAADLLSSELSCRGLTGRFTLVELDLNKSKAYVLRDGDY